MRAKKLLQLYAEGRRSFQKINLSKADFSGADLSEADFTRANLSEADFSEADLGNTIFCGANLSGSQFERANLWGADFRRANLNGANFHGADLTSVNFLEADLYLVRFAEADLSYANLCEADLKNANLWGANLREANLSNADLWGVCLVDANFSYADLSYANLSHIDFCEINLSYANLIAANVHSTNFDRATLTGACIEDWSINADTNFRNVICDFIYIKADFQYLSEGEERLLSGKYHFKERRPHDPKRIFKPGEFETLIEKSREAVDLIFQHGIDWKAFFNSFVELENETAGEISIRAIEKKSGGTFVIRVDVPREQNKAEIERLFNEKYDRELFLIEEKYKYQLQAQDEHIEFYKNWNTDLKEIVKSLSQQKFHIENKIVSHSEGNVTMTEEKNQTTYQQSGTFGIGHMSGGEIKDGAKVAGVIHEAEQQNLADAVAEVQQILGQLSQTYPMKTIPEKAVIAAKAVEVIEAKPNLKTKLINAGKEGGLALLEKGLDNVVGATIVGAIRGWQEVE